MALAVSGRVRSVLGSTPAKKVLSASERAAISAGTLVVNPDAYRDPGEVRRLLVQGAQAKQAARAAAQAPVAAAPRPVQPGGYVPPASKAPSAPSVAVATSVARGGAPTDAAPPRAATPAPSMKQVALPRGPGLVATPAASQ